MVCIRFSAWSNTTDASDSKTSFVTSIDVRPWRSNIFRPVSVSRSWNAGRQCMNFASGLPVASIIAASTWYERSSATRSSHTASGSPIDTQTSV